MISSLRIIHPPSSDNPTLLPVIILSIDAQRYLFNAPEGTTRAASQRAYSANSRALEHIFLPRVGVQECGGLFGLLMTRADGGSPQITLHGPPVLTHYLATARSYTRRDGMDVVINEAPMPGKGKERAMDNVMYSDGKVTISAIVVLPSGYDGPRASRVESKEATPASKRARTDTAHTSSAPTAMSREFLPTMFPGRASSSNDSTDFERTRRHQARLRALASTLDDPPLPPVETRPGLTYQGPALTFIVREKPLRGRFDAAKAKALGVPQGPLYRRLTDGADVEIQRPVDWLQWDRKRQDAFQMRARALSYIAKQQALGATIKLPKAQEDILKDKTLSDAPLETVVIRSADVVGSSRPGPAYMQVYLPSLAYLEHFLETGVQECFAFTDEKLHTIIHAVHPDVIADDRYKSFMKRFPEAHHLISNREYVPDKLAYPSTALVNLRMSRVDSGLFKVPQYSIQAKRHISDLGLSALKVEHVDIDSVVSLQPPEAPRRLKGSAPDFDHDLDSDDIRKLESFESVRGPESAQRKAVNAQLAWQKYLALVGDMRSGAIDATHGDSEAVMKLTALGTGSAAPSKYRNVSGTLVHLPNNNGYILLDCGEGTYGQLCRKFGRGVDDILRNLRVLFLSHIHGDHHMGATRVLYERHKLAPKEPLYVITTGYTRNYLQEVDRIHSLGIVDPRDQTSDNGVFVIDAPNLDFKRGVQQDLVALQGEEIDASAQESSLRLKTESSARRVLARNVGPVSDSQAQSIAQGMQRAHERMRGLVAKHMDRLDVLLHGCKVFTAEVDHRIPHCYGIIFRGSGWGLAYSGDTRPCDNLVQAGRDVDILIHEATFEADQDVMARAKGHSTVAQAVDVAQRMGAKRLLLTHFSQRYPKLTRISAKTDLPVGMAFDLMTIKLDDVGKTARYMEAFELLFEADTEDEEQQKTVQDMDEDLQDETTAASQPRHEAKGQIPQTNGSKRHMTTDARSMQRPSEAIGKTASDRNGIAGHKSASKVDNLAHSHARQLIKTHEFQYIVAHIYPVRRQHDGPTALSKFAFAEALQKGLEDLHGLVGASFKFDIILFDEVGRLQQARVKDGQSGGAGLVAVIKVAATHALTIVSTIAAGVQLLASQGGQGSSQRNVPLTCHYAGTLSAFDLGNVSAMVSRRGESSIPLPIAGAVGPPGRAWFESVAAGSQSRDEDRT